MPDKGPSLDAIAARPKKAGILAHLGTVHGASDRLGKDMPQNRYLPSLVCTYIIVGTMVSLVQHGAGLDIAAMCDNWYTCPSNEQENFLHQASSCRAGKVIPCYGRTV